MTAHLRLNVILSYMAEVCMKTGDNAPTDVITRYAFDRGYTHNQIEVALVQAAARGWIVFVDHHIHLTRLGHLLIKPANDNGR